MLYGVLAVPGMGDKSGFLCDPETGDVLLKEMAANYDDAIECFPVKYLYDRALPVRWLFQSLKVVEVQVEATRESTIPGLLAGDTVLDYPQLRMGI